MTRGFLMFAHNNPQVDYGLMALCNALMIKANSREGNVALVTDQGTYDWLVSNKGLSLVDRSFDHVIIEDVEQTQSRRYNDTQYTTFTLPWHNSSRARAYYLTPFDETILVDCDYLIGDSCLDSVWGSDSIRMNKHAISLMHQPLKIEQWLEPFGIPMYWATCVYFRKDEQTKTFFDLVEVIKDNYDYYQCLYRFPGKLFRNDYAFSIAAHIMNGWTTDDISLPASTILTSSDHDDLLDIPARNEFVFLAEDATDTWKYRVSRTSGVSVHVMNKFSIIRNSDKIIEIYGEA